MKYTYMCMECIECESSRAYSLKEKLMGKGAARGRIKDTDIAISEKAWVSEQIMTAVARSRGYRKMEENLFCVHYSHDIRVRKIVQLKRKMQTNYLQLLRKKDFAGTSYYYYI